MSEPTAPSTGQKITGDGGGTSWTYNEETELFTKRWPKEYFELWKGVPVLWSCNHVLDKSDSYEEVWSWRWATKKRKRWASLVQTNNGCAGRGAAATEEEEEALGDQEEEVKGKPAASNNGC